MKIDHNAILSKRYINETPVGLIGSKIANNGIDLTRVFEVILECDSIEESTEMVKRMCKTSPDFDNFMFWRYKVNPFAPLAEYIRKLRDDPHTHNLVQYTPNRIKRGPSHIHWMRFVVAMDIRYIRTDFYNMDFIFRDFMECLEELPAEDAKLFWNLVMEVDDDITSKLNSKIISRVNGGEDNTPLS